MPCSCPICGGSDFIRGGETAAKCWTYVPASFRVVHHVQPRLPAEQNWPLFR
ncbi:IS66 family transposase zinc-finger binding domain-containing protein [Rhizobium sp. CIAT894]|uniref:IS66 family transposase zinc-finger binding domain-containing protein n=1 Tax=Rhizobium sp. CIAT894 TaxID=2020312 RepID=UPI0032AF3EFB